MARPAATIPRRTSPSSTPRATGRRGRPGTYLLAGDRLTMTSGPLRGKRYRRQSDGFLRLTGPDGQDSDLRCVKRLRNNS